ncbi:hypothetical protein ACHWQZ_G009937 [Mnemiopsis leidyi]
MANVAPEVPPAGQEALQNQARNRDIPPLQVFRQPPMLSKDSDIHLYLRRFLAYTDSIGAREDDLVALLVNAASDEVLQKIERHLHDDLTFDELADILKRELGDGLENREEYKSKLRRAMRGRGETVREFYTRIWQLGRKSYPENIDEAIRDNAIRDAFICGFNDPEIAARLREHGEMNNEEILELAALLLSCKISSQSRSATSTVNVIDQNDTHTVDLIVARIEKKLEQILTDKIMTVRALNQRQDQITNNCKLTPELIDENTNTNNQYFDQTETGQNTYTDSTDYHSGLNSEQFGPTMDVTYNYDENNFVPLFVIIDKSHPVQKNTTLDMKVLTIAFKNTIINEPRTLNGYSTYSYGYQKITSLDDPAV